MTLEQLKIHNEFREKINNANDFYSMQLVYRSICSFFRISNIDTLYINSYDTDIHQHRRKQKLGRYFARKYVYWLG